MLAKKQEIIGFFESSGVKNYFSIPQEQWQNGLPEAINSIMMVARTIMAESGLGGRFWFRSVWQAEMPETQPISSASARHLGG